MKPIEVQNDLISREISVIDNKTLCKIIDEIFADRTTLQTGGILPERNHLKKIAQSLHEKISLSSDNPMPMNAITVKAEEAILLEVARRFQNWCASTMILEATL